MKTGTLKTLGAAALGVAFAAAAAGTATAAPMTPPANSATALGSLTGQLPLGQASTLVPGAAQATDALKSAPQALSGADGGGLLGGLPAKGSPVNGLTGALGGGGLPIG